MRRPDITEGGLGQRRADRFGIDRGAPFVGHRGGLGVSHAIASRGNDASDQRERRTTSDSVSLSRSGACAKDGGPCERHIADMKWTNDEERAQSWTVTLSAERDAVVDDCRLAPAAAWAYIFAPSCLAMPFMPPAPVAPIPSTLNSTSIGPACSKLSVALTLLALGQRMGEVREHQMIAAGREPDRSVRGNGEPVLDFAHLHHSVRRRHLMDFDGREIRRASVSRSGVAPLFWIVR